MGIEINLLPWRQEQRERRGKRFNLALGLMAVLGLGGGYAMTFYYDHQLDVQQQRNEHIRAESAQLKQDIRHMQDDEKSRGVIRNKIDIFSQLQQGRGQTVRVFNALSASLQEGVYYSKLSRTGQRLSLDGLAEDNYQVSDQLRALEAMPVLGVPVLSQVEGDEQGHRRFSLSVEQQVPAAVGEAP
ncbi:type IV pilus assembly protein PilN [Onishia taeanensis]|jgi:type IV pilus assembly protein PilN|uniref:Type IV pilus assembly protein PilN n=1 Tax=Onishia taeanensis TaxID=284577 RepID=A0A1G7P2S5_9GAMM|nr:PilN domain-containing protein [Halomonas taeanensis]SDF80605.1 type IV pilus assembly protein PilN [Halomonas taeanensis]